MSGNNSGWNIWNELADNGMQQAGELMRNANYEKLISWESSGEIVYSTGKSTPVLNRSSDLKRISIALCLICVFCQELGSVFLNGKELREKPLPAFFSQLAYSLINELNQRIKLGQLVRIDSSVVNFTLWGSFFSGPFLPK